ncbi:inner centromere protein A-like isoform X1, partial [Silurus asotus]
THSQMAARRRSIVWSFFQAEDEKRVLCLLCMKTVLYFGHTTNMLRHLRAKHPNDFSALDKRKSTPGKSASNHNNGCVEVTVMMDEQQVEVPAEVGEAEMDGAIRGILCAAAGEAVTEAEASGCEGEGRGTQEGSPGTPQTPSSRKWSAVWVHYRKVDQEKKALCLLCMEKIQHQSSTSNLIRHLQNKHPTEYAQLEEHSQKRPPKRKNDESDYIPVTSPKTRTTPTSRVVPSQISSNLTVDWSDGRRILERERELTEALRRVQQEEGRSLQQQRDLMQQIRELDAERRALQNQKREQEDEHHRLKKEKEDLDSVRMELQKEKEELQKERDELFKAKEEFRKEREELERQRQEMHGEGHIQGQVSEFYNC